MNTQRTILAQLIIARDNLEKVLGNLEELSEEEWDNLPFDYMGSINGARETDPALDEIYNSLWD